MQRSFPSNVKFLNEHTMACNVSHLPIIWTWKLHLNKNLSSKELALHSVKACSNFKYQLPVQDVGSGIKSKVLAFIVCCLRNLSGVKWHRNSYCFRLLTIPAISHWSRNEQLFIASTLVFLVNVMWQMKSTSQKYKSGEWIIFLSWSSFSWGRIPILVPQECIRQPFHIDRAGWKLPPKDDQSWTVLLNLARF